MPLWSLEDIMAEPRKMKGMKIHGGVAPKGTTKGGGPNGESGQSNSSSQDMATKVMLQRAKEARAVVEVDKARQKAEGRGANIDETRRAKKRAKF